MHLTDLRGAELRRYMIANGVIRPAVGDDTTDDPALAGVPCLALDEKGRAEAAKRVEKGRRREWDDVVRGARAG